MNDILKYKDALQYREVYNTSNITSENYQEKVQQTLKNLIDDKMGKKMTKAQELSSALY